jgi:hypothetical protein
MLEEREDILSQFGLWPKMKREMLNNERDMELIELGNHYVQSLKLLMMMMMVINVQTVSSPYIR